MAALVKVKTIVTLVVITVFAVMALRGDLPADTVMTIVTMVVAFYFGTQAEKTEKKKEEETMTPADDALDAPIQGAHHA